MASFVLVKRLALFAALPISLLFSSAALAYGPNGEEDRCTELGASCACGETFNTNLYVTNDGGTWWNPADTTGPKQCDSTGDNGEGMFAGSGINPNNADVIAEANLISGGFGDRLPGGQVDYVLRTQNNSSFPYLHAEKTDIGVRRMCQRHYFMRDQDMVLGGFKDLEFHIGDSCQNIWGNGFNGNKMGIFGHPSCGGTNPCELNHPCWGTGNLDQSHCVGHWCRVEFCAYGGLTGSDDVFVEGYVVRVDDPGIRRDYGPYNYGDIPGDGTGGGLGNKIWSGVGGDAGGNNINPAKLVSHGLQATWPTDNPGLFIGPAYEIEGGSGNPSPPPPAPESPEAPHLLQD